MTEPAAPVTPAPVPAPAAPVQPNPPTPSDDEVIAQAQNPDAVRSLIDRERDARRAAEEEARTNAARIKEIEDREKTAEQRAAEAQEAKANAEKTGAENLRLRVALKKGLTGDKAELADRLQGTTEAELEADADKLLALVGPDAPPPPPDLGGGTRTPSGAQDMDSRIRRAAGRG